MSLTTIRHILCPVDTSEPSKQAAAQAYALARATGARLTVLHVAQPIRVPLPEPSPAAASTLTDSEERAIRRWMSAPFPVTQEPAPELEFLVEVGVPATEILACAKERSIDLIVMGTHGTSGVEHLLLGSVTEKVLRRAACPVLTVPARVSAHTHLPFARVLCAVDFSECSIRALEFAMTTALATGASLLLAHILEWPWHEPPPPAFDELPPAEATALKGYRERREQQARERLERLEPEGFKDRCQTYVLHGRPYTEILRLAEAQQVDLIVLGVHGRSAVDTALFGSTTNQLVRHATCPVVTVRH